MASTSTRSGDHGPPNLAAAGRLAPRSAIVCAATTSSMTFSLFETRLVAALSMAVAAVNAGQSCK